MGRRVGATSRYRPVRRCSNATAEVTTNSAIATSSRTRKRVLAPADYDRITVTELTTGEILSTRLIEPEKSHWRNQQRLPGRWPSSPNLKPMVS